MAPSSSPISPSSPMKLLKTDAIHKFTPGRAATPLNSASSSSTTNMPPSEKRTRDQPNLSDCHCCGRRINHTNPKDRLQPMVSIWRVVLLCRKCRKKFASGQTCSYCFKDAVNSANLFKCSVCLRKIHKDCVREYGNYAPWCYLGVESVSRVCVDCWVPNSLKKSFVLCAGSGNKGAFKYKGDSNADIVKGANADIVKVKIAAKAKEKEFKKVKETANTENCERVVDSVANDDRNGHGGGISERSAEIKALGDADVSFRLHRANNSSPRIFSDKCLVNLHSEGEKSGNLNGLSSRSVFGEGQIKTQSGSNSKSGRNNHENKNDMCSDNHGSVLGPLTYKRDRKRKTWHIIDGKTVVSESGPGQLEQVKFVFQSNDASTSDFNTFYQDDILKSGNFDQNGSGVNIDRFGPQPIVYMRTKFKTKVYQENCMLEWSSCDKQKDDSIFQNDAPDTVRQELALIGTNHPVKCNNEMVLLDESSNADHDRYFVKYKRNNCAAKFKNIEMLHHECSESDRDHYLIKNAKTVTDTKSGSKHLNTHMRENQAFAPASSESGTVYNAQYCSEFALSNRANNEEYDPYFVKYTRRVKSSNILNL